MATEKDLNIILYKNYMDVSYKQRNVVTKKFKGEICYHFNSLSSTVNRFLPLYCKPDEAELEIIAAWSKSTLLEKAVSEGIDINEAELAIWPEFRGLYTGPKWVLEEAIQMWPGKVINIAPSMTFKTKKK